MLLFSSMIETLFHSIRFHFVRSFFGCHSRTEEWTIQQWIIPSCESHSTQYTKKETLFAHIINSMWMWCIYSRNFFVACGPRKVGNECISSTLYHHFSNCDAELEHCNDSFGALANAVWAFNFEVPFVFEILSIQVIFASGQYFYHHVLNQKVDHPSQTGFVAAQLFRSIHTKCASYAGAGRGTLGTHILRSARMTFRAKNSMSQNKIIDFFSSRSFPPFMSGIFSWRHSMAYFCGKSALLLTLYIIME